MEAKQFLQLSLGGNMNISTLKPIVFIEIMEDFLRYKQNKENSRATYPITIKGEYRVMNRSDIPIDIIKEKMAYNVGVEVLKVIEINSKYDGTESVFNMEFEILKEKKVCYNDKPIFAIKIHKT